MLDALFGLSGRRLVVTGAGRGLGRTLATGLAALGAKVALLARSESPLQSLADQIAQAGGTALPIPTDVALPESVDSAMDHVARAWGGIDAVISNAGINIRKPLTGTSDEDWRSVMSTNLDGAFHVSRAAAKHLQEGGRILFVGSVAGHVAIPTGIAYAASKGALEQMTRALAQELGPRGITVNCIAPWYFKTPLTEALLDDPDYLARVLAETPIKRLGPPEDLLGLAAYLCGPSASWLSGQVISLDGGFSGSAFAPKSPQ